MLLRKELYSPLTTQAHQGFQLEGYCFYVVVATIHRSLCLLTLLNVVLNAMGTTQ